MSEFALTNAQSVKSYGDLLCVANGSQGLFILDVSNPALPTLLGSLDTAGSAWDVVVKGAVAYVAAGTSGLVTVDMSDPSNPVQLGVYDTPNVAHGVDVSGSYCYVADRGGSGIVVVDVSDPTTPTFVTALLLGGDTWNVSIDGDLAYVSDTGASGLGLVILDVSDLASPTILGSLDPGVVRRSLVSGDVVYSAGNASVHVIDVSDPTTPTLIESWPNTGVSSAVAIAGDHAFVAVGVDGVEVLRVRNGVVNPLTIGSHAIAGEARDVDIAGDHAFVTTDEGVRTLNTSNPANPSDIGFFAAPGAIATELSGDVAVVVDSVGVRFVDVTDPTSPGELGFFGLSGGSDVYLRPRTAFVSGADSGAGRVSILDFTDPSNPTFLIDIAYPAPVNRLAFEGTWFLAAADDGFYVGSTQFSTPSPCTAFALAGNRAILVDTGHLRILDLTDPFNLLELGTTAVSGTALDVAIDGPYAFVATASAGVQSFDISDPSNPFLIGFDGTTANRIALRGELAFIAAGMSGLQTTQIFQRELDTQNNRGQSLPVDGADELVPLARITSTQTGSIDWEVSADGLAWQLATPGGDWVSLPSLGADLRWRSTQRWSGLNPTVDEVSLEWRLPPAIPAGVEDVPDDQGGWVRVHFTRSGFDAPDQTNFPVTGYQIYQRADTAMAARVMEVGRPVVALDAAEGDHPGGALKGVEISAQRTLGERRFVVGGSPTAGTFPPGVWEAVAWVAATQSESYTARVSTIADSTTAGVEWSVYLVTSHTTTPSFWFVSEPDSGYSIDNLAPGVPEAFAVAYNTGSGNTLSWDPAPEPDFQYWRVYRSTDPNFVPMPSDLVHETSTPGWVDPDYDGGAVYYQVTALDVAGNESDPAMAGMVTAISPPDAPARLALHRSAPNPFRPSTTIRYDVPSANADVEIVVFDAAGRRVRTLVDESVSAGRHEVRWDARDDRGRAVASGMYFYRMRSGSFAEMKKMLLLR